ncbi:hypothetical protein F511_23818 [Dorcoceras hygrometricum]|uniref:Dystroglycan-like n=1 Tax=Dorcoceras hygrometricum TaxID=472368 RepID=A0A2Z7AZ66_9LAMI|nr:hypothetical protein F511_23818 [Dorcoceras hygrometricum]
MASSFISNAHQVNFESVLANPDNEGTLNMFKALEASGLRGFLGCQSVFYEKELEQFFDTALVQDGDITGAVSGKFFSISQSRFAEVFDLPTEGLVDFSEVLKNLVYDARSIFSKSGVPVSTHGKKRFMKYEYRLLNDILAKAITVKASSFDAVTNERFLMMTAIQFGLKVNWSKIIFGVLKEMVDKTQKQAKEFYTVHTYIAMNHTIDARGQYDEPGMAPVAIVKRKSKSKKTSETTGETPMEVITEVVSKKRPSVESDEPVVPKKRRTTKSKASSSKASLDIVNVAQDVVPLQIVEPTPAATAEKSPLPKRKSKKMRLVLSKDSDDENVEEQESVKDTVAVLEETSKLATDEAEQREQHLDEPEFDSFQEVDSSEPNVPLVSGPTISVFTQEEQSYFVQSPESPPPSFQRRDSSTSFTDSPMHFNIDDIPLYDTTENQFSLPAISSAFSASLDDLRIFLSQRIDDSHNDILSRLNTLDRGHRDTMRQHEETLRNVIHNARQDN